MAGRPTPASELAIRGRRRHSSSDEAPEQLPEGAEFAPPDDFQKDEIKYWDKYVAVLRERGQLCKEVHTPLKCLCECLVERDLLRADIRKYGVTEHAGKRTRSTFTNMHRLTQQIQRWHAILGMTDAGRKRLNIKRQAEASTAESEGGETDSSGGAYQL